MNLKDETMRLAGAFNDAWYVMHDTEREAAALIAEACEGGEVTIPEHLRTPDLPSVVGFGYDEGDGVYLVLEDGRTPWVMDLDDDPPMSTYLDILHVLAAMEKEKETVGK